MHSIGASEARNNLPGLLKQVRDGQGPILIERRGKPLAALTSIDDLAGVPDQNDGVEESDHPEAEALFEQAEALAKLGHWKWDEIEDRCTYCSKGLANLIGVTVAEYLDRTHSFDSDVAWAHPDDRARYRAVVGAAIEKCEAFTVEYRLVRADGTVITVQEASKPILDDEGKLIATQGYVQDISDRKEAEQALRDSEARFRDFAEAASDWFWESGPDHRFNWLSERHKRSIGRTPDPLMGKTRREIALEDTETEKWDRHQADLEAHRPIRNFRYRTKSSSGEIGYRSVSATPVFDHQGEFLGHRGTASDITDLVRAEQALQQAHDEMGRRVEERTAELAASQLRLVDAIEAISEAFILFDADERLVLCNEKYRRLLPEIADLLVPGAALEDLLRAAAEQGQVTDAVGQVDDWVHNRLRLYRTPGEAVEYQLSNGRRMLARDRRTREGGIVGIRSDITAQKQAQEALSSSVQRLRDIAEAASDWFWELDADLRFTYLSDRYREIAGVSPNVFYGKRWEEVYPRSAKRQPEAWTAFFDAVAARQDFRHFTHDDFRQDGRRRVIRNTGKAVFAEDGSFLGYRGTSTDITKEVEAEEELRLSEARFKAVVENSPSAIYLKDLEGRYLLINKRCTEWYGPTQADALGKSYEALYPEEAAAGMEVRDSEVLRSGTAMQWETAFLHQDGKLHDTLVVKTPVFNEQGEIVAICGINTDITERKRAEAGQRESEQRLRSVVEHSPSAIYMKDPCGRFRMVNPQFEEAYGVTADEVIGMTTDQLMPPPYAEQYMALDRAVLETGKIEEHEVESPFADGTLHQLLTTKFPVHDSAGQVIGVGTIDTDLTERKRAEAQMRASEALFRALVEHSPMPISIKDLEGRYTLFSPAAYRYLSWKIEPVIGKTARDLFPPQLAAAIDADDQETARSGAPVGQDEELIRDYGDDSLLLTKFPIQDENGTTIGIGTIGIDVTERERIRRELLRSQARLAATLHQAKLAYRRTESPDGTISEWSKEAAEILGIAEKDLPRDLNDYLQHLHAEDRVQVEQIYRNHLLSAAEPRDYHLEYRFLRPDGKAIWLNEEATAESDWADSAGGYLCTIQDITANKQAEEQLRQAQKMEAVGQLTGGIAHDFNNLLAIIQGNSEFLLDEVGTDNESVQAIKRAADLGAELTRRLLAFSRQQPLKPLPVDLASLVAGMSDLLSRSLGETIEVVTEAETGLWIAAADPGQVQNALLNLAINARDAMPDGGRLTITCKNARLSRKDLLTHPEVAPGDYILLAVGDSGSGMSAEVLERAFEPFFTTKDFGQGSGLGLSMVYGFARQSGGMVTLSSKEGDGTCAKLFLPRQSETRDMPSPSPARRAPSGRGEVILVIEDEEQVRRIAMKMLKGLGYQVVGVPEAASAWDLLDRDDRVELVLSDVVLPGGQSGIAFAKDLEERFPEIGILFMSGYPADAAARDEGPSQDKILLNKPFQRAELAVAIRRVLDSLP